MVFLVATYGAKHVGMLLAHLHSIRQTHPSATIEVYHQDLPAAQFADLRRAYPDVIWLETAFDLSTDKIQRISSKTLAWEMAALRQPDGADVCLLDVDTLVRRDLSPFFQSADFDIIYTYREGGFALNTGVMLMRASEASRAFFRRWRQATDKILRDPDLFRQANDPKLPYGGGDQMALYQILGYERGRNSYTSQIDAHAVRFRGEPAAVLNETRSRPIEESTHVIHYKGGWQPILLDGRRFSKHRSRRDCWEMYLYYLDTFRAALAAVNTASGASWQPRDFGIVIPRYVDEPRGVWSSLLYVLHQTSDFLREIASLFPAALRLLRRRLIPCRD